MYHVDVLPPCIIQAVLQMERVGWHSVLPTEQAVRLRAQANIKREACLRMRRQDQRGRPSPSRQRKQGGGNSKMEREYDGAVCWKDQGN